MKRALETFRFNDKLMLAQEDRDLAARSFPNVFFALDHPALRADFVRLDREARRAKARSRAFGLAAIGLTLASLLTFPLEPVVRIVLGDAAPDPGVLRVLAFAGAASGVLAIVFGNLGLGFGASKRDGAVRRIRTGLHFSRTSRSQAARSSRHSRRAASRSDLNLALLSIFLW